MESATVTGDLKANRLRNDELRQYLLGGAILASSKIAALELSRLSKLIERLAQHDDFSETADCFNEHAFGIFDFEGATIVFRIETTSLTAQPNGQLPSSDCAEQVIKIIVRRGIRAPIWI